MTTSKKETEVQTLEDYRIALENAVNQTEIATTMAEFGYDATKIAEGKQFLEATVLAYNTNKQEDDETVASRSDFDNKKAALTKTYAMQRKKAKIVFRNDEVILKKLDLTGAVPKAYASWLQLLKTFYNGIQSDPAIQSKLTVLQLTSEDVSNGLVAITELETARSLYLKEIGESQDATKAKDQAFELIDKWMMDFNAVARIAMKDRPQLLEALGLLVRS